MEIICIGNSIVNGFPHERKYSFSEILNSISNLTVVNKGINGQSTDQILERFTRDVCTAKPDKVIIMTGSNDFIFDINGPEEAADNIKKMISKAKDYEIQVIIATPLLTDVVQATACWMPDMKIDYKQVNKKLKEFAKKLQNICEEDGAFFLDTQEEYKNFAVYCDGLHPTKEGQKFLADIIEKTLIGGFKYESDKEKEK